MSKFSEKRQEKKLMEVHNSNIPEKIRNKTEEKKLYSDKESIKLEEKMDKFNALVYRNCDLEKSNNLYQLIKMICSYYDIRYPDHLVDDIINKSIKNGINIDNGIIPLNYLFDALNNDLLSLLNKNIKNNYICDFGKYKIKFSIDENGIIKDTKISSLDKEQKEQTNGLAEEFNGLSLAKMEKLLEEYKMKDSAKYIHKINQEYFYKKVILENLFNYIMCYIINENKSINSCKKALLFANDFKNAFNLDIEIPLLYGISFNDENSLNFIKFYEQMGGRTNALCIPEYFDTSDKKVSKNSYPIHTYIQDYKKNLAKKKSK